MPYGSSCSAGYFIARPAAGQGAWLFCCLLLLAACDGRESLPVADDGPRIASLSPAITRTLVDLGLAEHIVGRTAFCRSVDASVPVVGDLLHLDYERLVRLQPTHVLTQRSARDADPGLHALADRHGWRLWNASRVDDLDDVRTLVSTLPGVLEGSLDAEHLAAAQRLSTELLGRLEAALAGSPANRFRGRVLVLSDLQPLTAFGTTTYMDDLLRRLGGRNALTARGWVQLSMEDLVRLDPVAVILLVDRSPADPNLLRARFAGLPIAAVRQQRLVVLAHPDALLPSSALISVAEALAATLRDLVCCPASTLLLRTPHLGQGGGNS